MKRALCLLAMMFLPVLAHATVTGTATTASFTCTGSTGPFPFTFPIDTAAAMTVTQNGAVLASSAYTISPVNNSYGNGGSVTLNTACPSGQTLVLQRITPITQLTQFTPYMPALYANIEDGLDQLTEIDQELYADYTTIKPACGTVPIGIPCGGTGATTPAAGLANLGGFPITGGTLTGPITAPSVTTSLLNNIVAIPSCGGVDDDGALNTAFSAAYFNNVVMFPAHSTCVYSGVWSVNTGVQYDLNGSTIKMTGTGGGTCSEGVNGLLQFTGSGFTNAVIHNGTLEAMNASAGCIVNIGAAGAGFANRIEVKNINFSTASGVTLPQAIYVSNAGNFYIHDNIFTSSFNYDIDSPDAAAQNNGFEISGNNFQTLNTISNYQVNLTNAQTGHIHDNVFESGPNGIKATGVINGLDIGSNWFGDPSGVGTSIYTGTSGSAVHIHDNFIYSSGTGSVGIQDNSQESTVENNYITLAGTCISTNSAAPQVTVIGNNCLSFGSTGLKANAPNMVIQNNLWSGLNASSIGVDSEAQNQTIGPNQYYVPGSGSVTINCGSTYDILMEPGANVPTACKTLSLHNTSLAPGNAAIFPDGITTTSCVGCGGSYLPLAGGTLTGALGGTSASFTGTVAAATMVASIYAMSAEYSNGTCTTSKTIAPANGNIQNVTLTNGDTCALTFTQPGSGTFFITLKVIQSAVSSYNGTISGCKWPGGTVPTITATTGAVDFVNVYLDGTHAYCEATQNFQ